MAMLYTCMNTIGLLMCCILFIVVWSLLSFLLSLENWFSILWSYFPFRWYTEFCAEERSCYMRWQCCHVTGMHPVFPAERSRMLLMLIGSFSQQALPCAPANNKRPCCLLRLINQTNATGGTKHVCKCTWAFLTCLPVYMAGGSRGFMHLCVWLRANVVYGRCQRTAWAGAPPGILGPMKRYDIGPHANPAQLL